VREQACDLSDTHSQVILGANDKHLLFRSCAGVSIHGNRIDFTLGTRVRCTNAFGHFYMAVIERVHHRYVAPALLREAVEHVQRQHRTD
jgi:hypothetical protein